MSALAGLEAVTPPGASRALLDAMSDYPAPLVPSGADGLATLSEREARLQQAIADEPTHRNAPWASAVARSYGEAKAAYQHRHGHSLDAPRVLARALLTPGVAFGADPRTLWVMAAHHGALAVAMDRKTGRRQAAIIGSRRTSGPRPTAYAPLHGLPWEGQEREDFLAGLPHLDAGWEFVRLRDLGGRPARMDNGDRHIYAALLTSDLGRQLCAASPALPRPRR